MENSRTHTKYSNAKLGFSYLELTAALFVFSVGLMAAFQTFHFTLSRMRVIKEDSIAMRAIQNEIETLRGREFDALETGVADFTADSAGLDQLKDARATVNVRPYEIGPAGLMQVDVVIRWTGDQGRLIEKSATTLIGDRGTTP
jgi:type II secretory pathway pseudopilin PulG